MYSSTMECSTSTFRDGSGDGLLIAFGENTTPLLLFYGTVSADTIRCAVFRARRLCSAARDWRRRLRRVINRDD